jgi:lysozyme family protein
MANFSDAYALTMKFEGGYSNNHADRGGETYKGISRNNNPHWAGWAVIDQIKNTHPANLNKTLEADATLTQQIIEFYKINYWNVNQTGLINDQQIADQVFDTAVNSGTGTAAKFLQEAAGVTVDRNVGVNTLNAVNNANAEELYNKFIGYRKQYYLAIIAKDPSQAQFKESWLSRLLPYKTV